MSEIRMPHDAMVLVGDGRKALFLRNHGDEKFPDLRVERVFADVNPPTHEQGADKPGRAYSSAGGSRRSGLEGTDWHDLEGWFAATSPLRWKVSSATRRSKSHHREPRTLASCAAQRRREKMHHRRARQDLTNHPVHEIKHLAG